MKLFFRSRMKSARCAPSSSDLKAGSKTRCGIPKCATSRPRSRRIIDFFATAFGYNDMSDHQIAKSSTSPIRESPMGREQYFPGLEGVIAGETGVSTVDGGLLYR